MEETHRLESEFAQGGGAEDAVVRDEVIQSPECEPPAQRQEQAKEVGERALVNKMKNLILMKPPKTAELSKRFAAMLGSTMPKKASATKA